MSYPFNPCSKLRCRLTAPNSYPKKKTKTRIYKPDSVFGFRQTPTIYLGLRSHATSSLPTPQHWASRPYLAAEAAARWCTWHCNPQGLSSPIVAYQRRALLPHIFTLTPYQFSPKREGRRRLFSVILAVFLLQEIPPVRWCGALCCPDFPHAADSRAR